MRMLAPLQNKAGASRSRTPKGEADSAGKVVELAGEEVGEGGAEEEADDVAVGEAESN